MGVKLRLSRLGKDMDGACLRTGCCDGLLWKLHCNFGLHRGWRISWL